MAVDHFPEQTLTRHRFSRSGDLWKHAVPILRRKPIADEVFRLLNAGRVRQNGSYRIPIACPYCHALKLTRDDTYGIQWRGGGRLHVPDPLGANSSPQDVGCLACGKALDPTDLLSDWKAKDLDRLLQKGPLAAYCPRPQTFIVDQPEPGKFWIGRTVYDALHRHVGPVFPLMRRLSRIEAMNQTHAMTLIQQHRASMTWRDVTITGELEPEDPAWHGGPLAPWEQEKIRRRLQAERRQKRAALAAELESIRRERKAELGL